MQATAVKPIVNYVLFSKSHQDAKNLAETVFGGKEDQGVVIVSDEHCETRVFLRWPQGSGFANPIGITEVLIVHCTEFSGNNSEVEAYIEQRSGIPVKIVLSSDEGFKAWESKGMIYTQNSSDLKKLAHEQLKTFDDKLKGAFTKHDSTGTGLNKEQFLSVCTELGVDGSEISEQMFSHIPKLTFCRFKAWWVFGKHDFEFWNKFLQNAGMIESLIVSRIEEIGKAFSSVVHHEESHELSHKGKLDIRSTQPFNTGLKLGWDLQTGDEHKKSTSTLPFALRHCPCFSFEIGIKDPSKADEAIAVLNSFKEMAKAMVPQVGEAIKMGVDLQFRVSENKFFFDVVVSGLLGGVILEHASKVNFDLIKYAGLGHFFINTGFSPLNVLSKGLEDIIKNASLLEVCGGGEFINIKTVIKIVTTILQALCNCNNKQMKDLNTVLNFVNVFKYMGFEVKYDPTLMVSAIKDTINLRSSQTDKFGIMSQKFSETQMMFNGMVEQGKSMAMFVADYVGLLKNIDLDSISFNFNFPIVRTFFRIYLQLPGITQFINENFLSG
jgi:hypothetical protein